MTAPRIIPPDVRACRSRPPIPDVSAFVSANAGSGKTHVLAQRVINLLLRGVDPAKILCITFTKAAAANMANRVFDTLAEWTTLDDAALDEKIALSTGRKPGAGAARAGAPAVRLGAGDAGRPEGADHPRLLHAAAAPVSVRGQCRRALHRARRGARPRNCSTGSRSTCCWKPPPSRTARSAARWRPPSPSPPTRPSRTWWRRDRRARRASTAWIDARRRHRCGDRRAVAHASASIRTTRLRTVEQRILLGFAHSASGMAGADRDSRSRLGQTDKKHIAALDAARSGRRARAHRALSAGLLHRRAASRARTSSPRRSRERIPTGSSASLAEQDRVCALARAASARSPRATARARWSPSRTQVIARYRAEKERRGAARLRRPDRQDAGAVRQRRRPPGCTTSSISASTTC